MILEHTIKYEATKVTCGQIVKAGFASSEGCEFYDPADGIISSVHTDRDWFRNQHHSKVVWLLDEISDDISLEVK